MNQSEGSSGPSQPESPPPPPPASSSPPRAPDVAPRSTRATTTVILGVIGIACCPLLGPVAWYLANDELKAIKAGRVALQDEGMAKAGLILGIIGTALLALGLLWILFFGGMAFIGALAGM